MLTRGQAQKQLEEIHSVMLALYHLVRYLHILWDDPSIERDIRETIMALYADENIWLQEINEIFQSLQYEWEVLWNGEDNNK